MDSACIPTASVPTAAITSGMQTLLSILFLTWPKDAVVDLLGIAKFAYDTLRVLEWREMFVVDSALYLNAVALPTVTSSIPSNSML